MKITDLVVSTDNLDRKEKKCRRNKSQRKTSQKHDSQAEISPLFAMSPPLKEAE